MHFKILTYVYKCLYGTAPSHVFIILSVSSNAGQRALLVSDYHLTPAVHRSNKTLKTADNRSLTYVVLRMWNHLPRTIRESVSLTSFKKCLKTYLYPK